MKKVTIHILLLISALVFIGCGNSDTYSEYVSDLTTEGDYTESNYTESYADSDFDVSDWTDETHSKNVDPNFTEVFDDTQVKRLDFVVSADRWQSMLDDMTATYGTFGSLSIDSAPPGGLPGTIPGTLPGALPTPELIDTEVDPIFVPADVYYNGKQWYRVGIRFKGNSSLQGPWQNGVLKLAFKLDFDEFEGEYPQIDNQRFYGFKKFSLKNNYLDASQMREKVAADVFKDAGLAVSHTAYYTLYVDHGEGPEYFGLYTLVEEVDGSVLDTQFSSDDGNLYKPEDGSADFVEDTFSQDDFTKKTNEDDEDWSDIEALFAALHDSTRTSDPTTWRTNLESSFNVPVFLKYLAVNGIIQNWDTYGNMPHNFYLYNDPDNDKLTWIPWDHNEALQEGTMLGALDLAFDNLDSSSWPLIAKIYEDATYKAQYEAYLQEVIDDAFDTAKMQTLYDTYEDLIEPYATTERDGFTFLNSSSDFAQAVSELKDHAAQRADAVDTYLNP